MKLHVRARFYRFARKFNSDLCIAAPYVQVRTKRRLRCPDQPDPRPDPNPNPNPSGGSRSALEVGRGCTEFTCNSKNLARTCNAWCILGTTAALWKDIRFTSERHTTLYCRREKIIMKGKMIYLHPKMKKFDISKFQNFIFQFQFVR